MRAEHVFGRIAATSAAGVVIASEAKQSSGAMQFWIASSPRSAQ